MNPACASSFNPLSRSHPPPPPTTTSPPPFTREYCSCCARSLQTSPHDKNSPMTTNPKNKTTCNSKAICENNLKCGLKCRNQARKRAQLRVRERERKLERRTNFGYNIFDCNTVPKRNPKKQNQKQETETTFIVAMFSNNFCFCKFSICCTQNTNSLYLHTQKTKHGLLYGNWTPN